MRRLITILHLASAAAALFAGCAGGSSASREVAAQEPLSIVEIVPESRREEIDRYFTEGAIRALQGDHHGALRYFMAALRVDSDHAPSLEAVSRSWQALEEYDSALHYARRAVESDSDDLESRRLLAGLWIDAGNFDSAAAEYERILLKRPNDLQARYIVARTWERRNPAKAIGHYEYIRDNIAEDFNSLMGLYELYARRSDYASAASTLRLLLTHYPEDPTLYEMLCGVWTDAERYDSATAILGQADLHIDGRTNLESFLNAMLSLTELRLRGMRTPSEDFQRFADSLVGLTAHRIPDRPKPIYLAGMIALRTGDATGGDTLLMKAFRTDHLSDIAWTEAATFYLDDSAHGRLLNTLGPSSVRYDESAEVIYSMALAFNGVGKADSALLYLGRATRVDPDYANAWLELARIQSGRGETGPAIASFEQALSADPYDPELLNEYAVTLARKGVLIEKGKSLIDRALGIEPENETFLTTRGWFAYLEKDYESAVEYLQHAVDAGGATAERLELLGDARRADGDEERALEAYERALRVNELDRERELRLQQKLLNK